MDILREYASPPTNYIGTTVFLSYIVAALYLTFSIVRRLSEQWPVRRSSIGTDTPGLLGSRMLFAALTFATLSYNMLSFLINSYVSWRAGRVFDVDWVFYLSFDKWMLQSSLFDDFAHQLIGTGQDWTAIWTILSLLWTGAVNVWMALAGRQSRIEGLWRYFLLAQILPVSFTHCLFSIAVALQSVPAETVNGRAHGKKQLSRISVLSTLTPSETISVHLTAGSMMALINLLLKNTNSPYFLPLVLAIRLLLFFPYLMAFRQPEAVGTAGDNHRSDQPALSSRNVRVFVGTLAALAALLIGSAINRIPASEHTMKAAWQGLNQNWAVRALGYDFLLGLCS